MATVTATVTLMEPARTHPPWMDYLFTGAEHGRYSRYPEEP